MNQTQALAKARKLLGLRSVVIEVRKSVPVGDERIAEIERREVLTEKLKTLNAARDARRAEVLKADAEYQRLRQEAAAMEKERDNLHGPSYRRVSIYTNEGFAMRFRAGGDNLEEAIAALEAEQS